jgi:hypothetical protein
MAGANRVRAATKAARPCRIAVPRGDLRRSFSAKLLTLKEFLRGHRESLSRKDLLGSVHNCRNGGTTLMSGESISLSNEFLDFRNLHRCGFLRVLDVGDPLVVIVSNPSKALAQVIDCVSALFKGVSFNLVLLRQIKVMFFALLKAEDEIVSGVPVVFGPE